MQGFLLAGTSNESRVVDEGNFGDLSGPTSLETSEIRLPILYNNMLPLVGLWVIAKWMTLRVFWPFKVIQGRWFSYQSKAHMQLPIWPPLRLRSGPILHHFWDTETYWLKIVYFPYPSLIRPCCLCSLWNFVLKLTMRKLESWGYAPVYCRCHDCNMSHIDTVPATI